MQSTAQKTNDIELEQTPKTAAAGAEASVAPLVRDDFDRNIWCVLGLPVDMASIDSVVNDIDVSIQNNRRLSFVTPNVNWLVRMWRDKAARREILDADLSIIDGAPLLAIARLAGVPAPSRVAGSDLFETLRRRPAFGERKLKVFFFGGREGAAEAAAKAIEGDAGPLEAVGWLNPGFGDVEAMSEQRYIDEINAANPDFVVVSLGGAKGQAWIDRNKMRLNAPITSHLGAVVDFTAGSIARSPGWMRRFGLEWLWRIKEEPSLWRRYYNDGVALAGLLLTRFAPQLTAGRGVKSDSEGDAVVSLSADMASVRLSGVLGRNNLRPVREAFRQASAAGTDVRLDFADLKNFDRAFLGQVLMLEKALNLQGARLFMDGADKRQRMVLRANQMSYSQSGANTQKALLQAARGEVGGSVA